VDDLGEQLARRHVAHPAEANPTLSLLNYAEASRDGDWTLRSALVRLAQPPPALASAVLEQVRRCDAALHPIARALEAHTVVADHQLDPALLGDAPIDGYPDARVSDIARLVRSQPDQLDRLVAGYESVAELSEVERLALPILVVALQLDELGAVAATWASAGFENPPVAQVERLAKAAFDSMEHNAVPKEQPPSRR